MDDDTHVADMRTALCARSRLHFLTFPVFHRRVVVVHVLNARMGFDTLPIADDSLLEVVVGYFTAGDAGVVFFVRGGQVDDVGGGNESADGEEALVL